MPDEQYYSERGEQGRRWGAILLVAGVVWLVFELTSRGSLFGMGLGFVERSRPIAPQTFTVERVVVSGVNDDIELVGTDGEEVLVEGTIHGFGWNGGSAQSALDQIDVVVEQRGRTLNVEVRRPRTLTAFIGRAPYVELRLALPPGLRIEASTVSGDLALAEVEADGKLSTVSGTIVADQTRGDLTVSTTSGEIELADHSGPLALNSISGDMTASGEIERPRVETVSGDVELAGVSGPAEVSSISGSILIDDARAARLKLESTSGDIEVAGGLLAGEASTITNISGDVTVALDNPRDLRLEVSTISGDLESDLDLRDLVSERRRLAGVVGDGSASLIISTTSGDVSVQEP